jgi:predicted RNase H-like nuclease
MAPTNDSDLKLEASKSFFNNVNTKGYPAVQQKDQPWRKYVAAAQENKKSEADGRMVVICSLRHDYGISSSPAQYWNFADWLCRYIWTGRLLESSQGHLDQIVIGEKSLHIASSMKLRYPRLLAKCRHCAAKQTD